MAQLRRAQRAVAEAERRRDDLAKEALVGGLGVRGIADALEIDKATVSRRYGTGA
jgi:heterodisulfide reductase subunit A-like polyferredoxin